MASTAASKPKGYYSSCFWTEYLTTQYSKLPLLPDIDTSISDRVVRFLGCNPGDMQLQGTNTYLVGTGKTRILIDTGEGFSQWAMNLTRYLEDHDLTISHILLTHWHHDHTGGVADLVAYDSSIRVHKNRPDRGQQPIQDGQVFSVQGATLRAVPTPGHSVDHTCFVLEEDSALFTGDNVLGQGFSVAENLGNYTASLRVMARLGCGVGYPGHGDVILDLPRRIARYICQRDSRERRVLAALVKHASGGGLYDSSSSSDTGGGNDDENDMKSVRGLSLSEIALLVYGELSKDAAAFESALKPLLSQVLHMLTEHGKAGSKLVGPDKTRYWFARVESVT